jgi:truncated hemoglobin YjbI
MARLKLLDSISELKVKGDVHPLRTAIQERVGRPLRSTVKPLNEQVSDIIRQIEIEEGAELSTMLPYEDLLSIREEIIPEVIGGIINPMDNFESQFQSMFGKPKKAAGGVVSLYNRPGYGLGGDIWNTITGSKIGDVAKWGYNQFTGEGRKKEEEKYKRWVNKPLVYPQMTKEQFDAYQGEDYLNKLLEMESEMIPKSSVIDTRPGSSTGYEQIYSDINELMTNMPPTERGEAEVENFVDTFGPDQRYQFHYVDPDPEIGGMPLSAEQYYEYQQDPEKRMNTYIIDQMGPIHNYLEIGNKELERKYQNFEITENKYAEELNKLDNAAKKIDKRNKELSEQLENGEITQNEFDIQMGQQAENLRSIQDFLPSYEMEGPMASVYQPYNPLAQDPNHPLYKYEMATRFGTNQDLGYEKYPGSEGYGDRYSEDLLRLGGNTAAQFAHFLLGEGINLSFALTPTTSFREGKMPEFWAEEVRKQGGNPEGLLEKFIGTDPYKVKGLYDWMRTWNPNWAVGAGGAADMLSGLGGWFFNKDWNPNFTEMLKDKDWRIFGDHALSKYLPFLKD